MRHRDLKSEYPRDLDFYLSGFKASQSYDGTPEDVVALGSVMEEFIGFQRRLFHPDEFPKEDEADSISKLLVDIEDRLDPKLIVRLWDKYVFRAQENENLQTKIKILKSGGFKSQDKLVSPLLHHEI
jgi:hypothetical protein